MNILFFSPFIKNIYTQRNRRIIRGLSFLLSLLFLLSVGACATNQNAKTEPKTNKVDYGYFSGQKLELIKNASFVTSAMIGDKVGILETTATEYAGTQVAEYDLLLYDKYGAISNTIKLDISAEKLGSVVCMTGDSDGNEVLVSMVSNEASNNKTITTITTFNSDGKIVGDPVAISENFEDGLQSVLFDTQGNMYFVVVGKTTVFDKNGKEIYSISNPIIWSAFIVGNQVYVESNEVDKNDISRVKLYPLDNTKKELGAPVDMTKYAIGGLDFMSSRDGLFAKNDEGIYAYDFTSGKMDTVLRWSNSDFSFNGGSDQEQPDQLMMLSKDRIIVLKTDMSSELEAYLLVHDDSKSNDSRKTITIAGLYLDHNADIVAAVSEFNKNSSEYQIEMKDYANDISVIESTDSFDEAQRKNEMIRKMNLDILSGNCPDILLNDGGDQFTAYEKQGLFIDLYTLMENDKTIKKEDFLQNMLRTCEADGHLFKMGTKYTISGLVGVKSVVGDRKGWTVDEFNTMSESLPDGKKAYYSNQTQSAILDYIFANNINEFVNQTTGKVNFDTETFYSILDIAKTYGANDENPQYSNPDFSELAENYAVSDCSVSSISNFNDEVFNFGQPIDILGYPSENRNSAAVSFAYFLSISSKSKVTEGSWEFVKTLLTEEAQTEVTQESFIPIRTSALEAEIERALHPTEDDLNYFVGLNEYQTQPLSKETAQAFMDLVNNVDCLSVWDQDIINVINQEAPAYFTEQKSAKDVAALINNRVQTVVEERG